MRRGVILLTLLLLPRSGFALSEKGFERLHTFSQVLHYISQQYVEELDEEELVNGAIRGLVSELDPYSSYLSSKVYQSFHAGTDDGFGGIGLEVTIKNRWVTVVAPIDGSPAAVVGVRAGDRVVKINGRSTKQMDLSEAASQMRGRSGSRVTLTIQRGASVPFDVVLKRASIQTPSVRTALLAPGYPYVRVTSFTNHVASDLEEALGTFAEQGPIQGLVLDVRNNPGGYLHEAIAMCNLFLKDGVIMTMRSRGKETQRYTAKEDNTQPPYPMVVLINGGSASASEIVAGALQDRNRATVLGTQSFGKGTVQTVVELADGAALKLTIARYFTPKKHSIQAFGVTPSVVVPDSPGDDVVVPSERGGVSPKRARRRSRVALPDVALVEGDVDYQRAMALALLQDGTVSKKTGYRLSK